MLQPRTFFCSQEEGRDTNRKNKLMGCDLCIEKKRIFANFLK